jgi:hypothetical protein
MSTWIGLIVPCDLALDAVSDLDDVVIHRKRLVVAPHLILSGDAAASLPDTGGDDHTRRQRPDRQE